MNDFGQDRTAECIPGCRLSLLKRIFKRILGLSANTYTHVCASSDCTMCVLFSFSFGCIVFERVAVIILRTPNQAHPTRVRSHLPSVRRGNQTPGYSHCGGLRGSDLWKMGR